MSRRPIRRTPRRKLFLTRLEDRIAPAVATWDGGGADNKWSTAANWVGDVAPQPGDDLVFPAGVRKRSNVNDLPADTVFHSIAVNGASTTLNESGYQISGNAVRVTAGVTADFARGVYSLDSTSTLSLDVSGTGGVTKAGTGRFVLAGNNSYTGVTTVSAGILEVQTDTGLGAIGAGNETTVVAGATLDLNNLTQLVAGLPPMTIAEPIAFAGDGVFENSSILGAIFGEYRPLLTGPLTLTGNGRIAGFLTITAGIGETGGPRDLFMSGPTIASAAVNTYTGTTTVSTVQFDGRGPGPVVVDGDLVGTGTINGPVRFLYPSSSIRGGTGIPNSTTLVPGTLTVGDLDLSQGTLRVVIGAEGASEIAARGTVRLGGNLDVSLQASQPSDQTPFRLRVGDRFRILDNDGTDPVEGTFAGLPEGGLVKNIRPFPLRLSYHGGDGNDVVLEAASAPATAVGAVGGPPTVNVYDADGTLMRSFLAYGATFGGGVRVAVADITDDGILDLITAAGPGGGPP